MNEKDNVTEQLKELMEAYCFNVDTLSKYLGLPADKVRILSQGDISFLPEDNMYRFRLFNKISFLYLSATEDKDLKLCAFLQVLISHHGLSKKTIAKMAGVDKSDIEKMISNPPRKVSEEIKYKVAVTVMSLRFFLKECEPEQ
ncbi:hypothetical protein IMSAGC019_03251 [Lachnospiraceae bacterium]|nr:hypothetical protein IMSAGC019_03251 [Lachnospiraceae bacterium]